MDVAEYLDRAGVSVSMSAVLTAQAALEETLREVRRASMPATPSALNRLYTYPVPRLSADGTCSVFDELEPTPYDLSDTLGGRGMANTMSLLVLGALLDACVHETQLDWLGVYQARARPSGRALVKLSARGAPSRAEFPLTEAFAARSNNVTVALRGRALILGDVLAHAQAGGAYYECDPKVRSEACLPLFDRSGAVIGILDAEHSVVDAFGPRALGWLVALAHEVPSHLPLV